MDLSIIGLEGNLQKGVLLIEEELGNIKSIFIQRIGFESIKLGKTVLYISTKLSKEDVLAQMSAFGMDGKSEMFTILGDFKDRTTLLNMCYEDTPKYRKLYPSVASSTQNISGVDLCIVDTLTSLFIDVETHVVVDMLNSFIDVSRHSDTMFLLAADMGVCPERVERIMRSMVDGIIQFRTIYAGDKINRVINIPKLEGVLLPERMIPYHMTSEGISIDTRERVG